MKKEELQKMSNLCDEFDTVFEKVSATLDMLNQFQNNQTEVSKASISGSAWIMDDVQDSLETLKSKFYMLNQDMKV